MVKKIIQKYNGSSDNQEDKVKNVFSGCLISPF